MRLLASLTVLTSLHGAACGKDTPPPDTSASIEAPEVAAVTPPTPAEACAALLERALGVARTNLADVAPLTPAIEASLRHGSDFVRVCLKLSEPERACLAASDSPAKAALSCPNSSGEPLVLPDLSHLLQPAPPATVPEADASAALSRLAGTWRRVEATSGVVTRWTVAADGTVTEASQTQAGRPVEGAALPARVAITRGGRLELFWPRLGSQSFVFIEAGPDVFYASADMRAAPVSVPDPSGAFTLSVGSDFLHRRRDGSCRLLTPTGHAEPARCALSAPDASGERTFSATFVPPASGAPTTVTWQVHGQHFFPPDLVREGRFERQRPPSPETER